MKKSEIENQMSIVSRWVLVIWKISSSIYSIRFDTLRRASLVLFWFYILSVASFFLLLLLLKKCLFINITRHQICVSFHVCLSIYPSFCDLHISDLLISFSTSVSIHYFDCCWFYYYFFFSPSSSIHHQALIIVKIPWIDEFANGCIVCLKSIYTYIYEKRTKESKWYGEFLWYFRFGTSIKRMRL